MRIKSTPSGNRNPFVLGSSQVYPTSRPACLHSLSSIFRCCRPRRSPSPLWRTFMRFPYNYSLLRLFKSEPTSSLFGRTWYLSIPPVSSLLLRRLHTTTTIKYVHNYTLREKSIFWSTTRCSIVRSVVRCMKICENGTNLFLICYTSTATASCLNPFCLPFSFVLLSFLLQCENVRYFGLGTAHF